MTSIFYFSSRKPGLSLKRLVTTMLFCLSVPCLSQSEATDESSSQWYQVELFVFASTSPQAGATEQWPESPGLRYPATIVSLKPNTEQAIDIDQLLSTTTPEADKPGIAQSNKINTQQTEVSSLPDNETADNAASSGETANNRTSGAGNQIASNTPPGQSSGEPAAQEQAFVLLEPAHFQLQEAVNNILAQPDFRLLFHGAWRQIIGKRTEATSILITGGRAFDQHFELEGSINLSVERYLHINTDLWLSTFVQNRPGEQMLWPVLPPLPTSSNTPAVQFAAPQPQDSLNFTQSTDGSLGASLQQALDSSFNRAFNNPFRNLHQNQYTVQRTVVMRQHRRMRSSELHYIDHPMMGLLIKITPYEIAGHFAPANDKTN